MKVKNSLLCCFVAAALFLAASPAFAIPVVWTFNDVFFLDGTKLTGSFVYDQTTGTVNTFSLQTELGDIAAAVYDAAQPGDYMQDSFPPSGQLFDAFDSGSSNALFLSFLFPLTNAGGTVGLVGSEVNGSDGRLVAPYATATGNPVPEPTTMLLFGAGLVGLAGIGRKRFKK